MTDSNNLMMPRPSGALDSPTVDAKPSLLLVLYANPDYYPPTRNAVSILSEYFQVEVVCRNVGERVAQWPFGVSIERIGAGDSENQRRAANAISKILELRGFMAAVRRAIARVRPAVIYAHDSHAFCAALSARRIRTTPVIFQLHELPEIDALPLRSLQTWVIRRALRETAAANLMVFPERRRAEIWMGAAADHRSPLIVPNCSTLRFTPDGYDVARMIDHRWAAKKALYLGAVGEDNGHREAVRALAFVPPNVSLEIVGNADPEFVVELARTADASGTRQRLSLTGFVEHARLVDQASDMALGLCLYKPVHRNWEFSGSATNKLFEYAALGLPVVVPDRASYREFLAAETWVAYADPSDAHSIARAIEFVLTDRRRYSEMSMAARRAFETRFNYEHVFDPVLRAALELAHAAPGKSQSEAMASR